MKYCNSVFGREAHDEGTEIVEIIIPGRKLAIKMARAQEQANQVTAPNQSLDVSSTAAYLSLTSIIHHPFEKEKKEKVRYERISSVNSGGEWYKNTIA